MLGGDDLCSRMLDSPASTGARHRPGGALHLRGGGLCDEEARARGNDARVLAAPVVEGRRRPMATIAPDAMEDNAALRAFDAHMAKAHSRVVQVARPLLMDFLAVNWTLHADDTAFCRWSFENEIAAVYIYPSFLVNGDAAARLQRVRRRWPNARIFWNDAENTPTAFARALL